MKKQHSGDMGTSVPESLWRDEGKFVSKLSRRAVMTGGLGIGLFVMRPDLVLATPGGGNEIAPQPYFANVVQVVAGMRLAGEPMNAEDEKRLKTLAQTPSLGGVSEAEEILDRYTLLRVRLDESGMGQAKLGGAKRELVEQGWRAFLVRVENPSLLQQELGLYSDSARAEGELSARNSYGTETAFSVMEHIAEPEDVAQRWLGYQMSPKGPVPAALLGATLEYRIVQLYSRDRGQKRAWILCGVVNAPWFRRDYKNGVQTDFDCLVSSDVVLGVRDWDGAGTVASFLIRDALERVYPAPMHRLEPDFDFQPQIYRADGESVRLPEGRYHIEVWRGPEYVRQTHTLIVSGPSAPTQFAVRLERWINAPALGWYPGDTHVHAAGCAHYEVPTLGVTPETMIRHVRGEALAVGDVLTWAPGFYYQKQFFTGHVYQPVNILGHPEYQQAINASLEPKTTPHDSQSMVRYDIEVSGFPSSHSGHLVLLRLKDQDYRGVKKIDDWPSWNLPVLKWAREQGAIVGYPHCGDGMFANSHDLPNYELPPFDMDGANEFVVDVTQGAVDFVSCVGNLPVSELNFWYHALNCGFRVPMLGETDFPCFSDERVGTNRTYVGLERAPVGDTGFSAWVEGIKRGRVYFGDGRTHFINYRIDGHDVGGEEVRLSKASKVTIQARIAARLNDTPLSADDDHLTPLFGYWNLERARIGQTRRVALEVVVNGTPVFTKELLADGTLQDFSLDVLIEQSSWVVLRVLPSGHTAPIYVTVKDRPIRISRRSAQWSRDCVDLMWKIKSHRIRLSERPDAAAAYDQARRTYDQIKSECLQD